MYDLDPRAPPWRERRRMLATFDLRPQALGWEIDRDLQHLKNGTCAFAEYEVPKALVKALRSVGWQVLVYPIGSRLALMAAVFAASRMFSQGGAWQQALGISAAYLVCQLIGGYWQSKSELTRGQLGHGAALYLTTRINAKLLQLGPASSALFTSGMLKNLISSDVKYFAEFLSSLALNLVPAALSLLLLGPMIYLMAGLPGVVGIAVAFAYIPIAILFSGHMEAATAGQQRYLDQVATTAGEWLRNVRLSRYLGWQAAFEADLAVQVRQVVRSLLRRHVLACVTFGISFAWWMVAVIAMLLTARASGDQLDLIGFFATLWVIKDLSDYLQHLPHTFNIRASALACLKRLQSLEAAPNLHSYLTEGISTVPLAGATPTKLVLFDVAFGYAPETPLFRTLNLEFDLRERTAIVGTVGAGKTTLLRLLCGDLVPTSGTITVHFDDGSYGSLWDRGIYEHYRQHLAYVPQEPFIANDTLAANVSLNNEAPGDRHIEAAALAELTSDLALLDAGFATAIGEAGVNLSGGQRQRVNLARAFYAKRSVMLLDDPLSAVDGNTEQLLMQHLGALSSSFILVTHRLAELSIVDRILVLGDGCILEDGRAATLLRNPISLFRQLGQAGCRDL